MKDELKQPSRSVHNFLIKDSFELTIPAKFHGQTFLSWEAAPGAPIKYF